MGSHDLAIWARDFLAAVTEQDRDRLRGFFAPGAAVYWPNTGEKFSLEDYLTANCEYPGQWRGQLLRAEGTDIGAVVAARVWEDGGPSCHVVTFHIISSRKTPEAEPNRPPASRYCFSRRCSAVSSG